MNERANDRSDQPINPYDTVRTAVEGAIDWLELSGVPADVRSETIETSFGRWGDGSMLATFALSGDRLAANISIVEPITNYADGVDTSRHQYIEKGAEGSRWSITITDPPHPDGKKYLLEPSTLVRMIDQGTHTQTNGALHDHISNGRIPTGDTQMYEMLTSTLSPIATSISTESSYIVPYGKYDQAMILTKKTSGETSSYELVLGIPFKIDGEQTLFHLHIEKSEGGELTTTVFERTNDGHDRPITISNHPALVGELPDIISYAVDEHILGYGATDPLKSFTTETESL